MARYTQRSTKRSGKVTHGKPFRKKSNRGKHPKGTLIKYKYQNGRRVGAVKHSSRRY